MSYDITDFNDLRTLERAHRAHIEWLNSSYNPNKTSKKIQKANIKKIDFCLSVIGDAMAEAESCESLKTHYSMTVFERTVAVASLRVAMIVYTFIPHGQEHKDAAYDLVKRII